MNEHGSKLVLVWINLTFQDKLETKILAELVSEVADLNSKVSVVGHDIACRYSTIRKTMEDIEQMGQESDKDNEQASIETSNKLSFIL